MCFCMHVCIYTCVGHVRVCVGEDRRLCVTWSFRPEGAHYTMVTQLDYALFWLKAKVAQLLLGRALILHK